MKWLDNKIRKIDLECIETYATSLRRHCSELDLVKEKLDTFKSEVEAL